MDFHKGKNRRSWHTIITANSRVKEQINWGAQERVMQYLAESKAFKLLICSNRVPNLCERSVSSLCSAARDFPIHKRQLHRIPDGMPVYVSLFYSHRRTASEVRRWWCFCLLLHMSVSHRHRHHHHYHHRPIAIVDAATIVYFPHFSCILCRAVRVTRKTWIKFSVLRFPFRFTGEMNRPHIAYELWILWLWHTSQKSVCTRCS